MRAVRGAIAACAVAAVALFSVQPAAASAPSPESGTVVPSHVAGLKTSDLVLRGINAAGAEFTPIGAPVFDSAASFDYLASRGYSLVRLPFRWESVQRTLSGPLDPAGVRALQQAVAHAAAAGLAVVLDVHNDAAYQGVRYGAEGSFTQADFADLWSRLAELFRSEPAVVGYGLMNEPRDLPEVGGVSGNERWQRAQQAALDAIRAQGDVTCVLVSGYTAGSMGAWLSQSKGQPEPYILDPTGNFRWEAHHYWDAGNTGSYSTSYADAVASGFGSSKGDAARTRTWFELDQWLNWLEQHDQKGFIGEFGWPSAENGLSADEAEAWESLATIYLERIDEEDPSLVWTAAWATGARWSEGYALQYYDSTDGVISTALSNAAALERFSASVLPTSGEAGAASAPSLAPPAPAAPTVPSPSTPHVAPRAPAPAPAASVVASAPAAPTVLPPEKAQSRTVAKPVNTKVTRKGLRAKIRVTVRSSREVGGTVTVHWKGKLVAKKATLKHGKVLIRLSERLKAGKQNLVVRYSGSSTVGASADRSNRLNVKR